MHPTLTPPTQWRIDYANVDWSLSNKQLGAIHNAPANRFGDARRQYAPDSVRTHTQRNPTPRKRGHRHVYNWASVNWEHRDIDISRQLGCTRERVRQVRLLTTGKPKPQAMR